MADARLEAEDLTTLGDWMTTTDAGVGSLATDAGAAFNADPSESILGVFMS
jgi:hypothetical protein